MASRRALTNITSYVHSCTRGYSQQGPRLSNVEVRRKRTTMFGKEKARQASHVSRIEKIEVVHEGPPDRCQLLMNKGLSTPYNCAMHLGELLTERSVLALVNGQPWDMHRPLAESCSLRFLHFKEDDPALCNESFWRSCSFILGHILETAFKDDFYVELCSFPRPNVASGSFLYDVDLKLPNWQPTETELRCLSRAGARLGHQDLPFERLDVDANLALDMFSDNRFKVEQIPSIAAQSASGSSVTLYRMGDHVDLSRGPLISSTKHINRFNVVAAHAIDSTDFGPLRRVQGVAMPKQLHIHYWTYEFLQERAAKLNRAAVPRLYSQPAAQPAQVAAA